VIISKEQERDRRSRYFGSLLVCEVENGFSIHLYYFFVKPLCILFPSLNTVILRKSISERVSRNCGVSRSVVCYWGVQDEHSSQQEKKGFNGGYLAEVGITLGIDLINEGFLTFIKFQRLFKNLNKIPKVFLTFVKFQRFILKPQQNNRGFLTFVKFQKFILKLQQNNGGLFNLR